MDRLAELKAKRGLAADKLQTVVEGPETGFDPKQVTSLETEIKGYNEKIDAIERSRKLQASLAVKGSNQPNGSVTAPAQPKRYFGNLKSFKGPDAAELAYRSGQFIRATVFRNAEAAEWCRDNGIVVERAQGEGVNSAGGVLVPEEMMASIIILRETYGVFRRETRVVPMARDTLNWPRRTGGLTAYFVGENQTLTQSQATFDNVNLTAKKLAALTLLSTEIAEDAVVNIADYIVNEVAYAFAKQEDACGINGDGTSTYGGIRGITTILVDGNHNAGKFTAATGHNTYALLDAIDMTGLMGLLPQYALPHAKFYASQTCFAQTFERLIATAGGNRIDTLDGSIVYRYLGFPIVISQQLPLISTTLTGKAMLFFGDLALASAMGERRGVTIRRLDERFADNDQIGVMGTERFDINVHDMGDNNTAGPLVGLAAP